MQFQVQRTPAWDERGRGGWFLTESQPVAFADADVLDAAARRRARRPATRSSRATPVPTREPFRLAASAERPARQRAPRDRRRARDRGGLRGRFARWLRPPLRARGRGARADPTPGFAAKLLREAQPGGHGHPRASASRHPPTRAPSCGRSSAASSPSPAAPRAPRPRWVGWWPSSSRLTMATYTAVLGHLSEIEPSLLDLDPAAPAAHHRPQRAARPLRRHPAAGRGAGPRLPRRRPGRPRATSCSRPSCATPR